MALHKAGEDYLKTILILQGKKEKVRSADVARSLAVSKPSVSHAVGVLRDEGYLIVDEGHFLHLTESGMRVAREVYEKNCFFRQFLEDVGVSPMTAATDACRIEHAISWESFQRVKAASGK